MTDKHLSTQENETAQKIATALPIHRTTPAVDIYETDAELVLLAEMPGVDEQGLQIEVERNLLTLAGEVAVNEGAERASYYRQFKLSERFDSAAGEASLKDGVLRLRIPKAAAAMPKKIAVKTLH